MKKPAKKPKKVTEKVEIRPTVTSDNELEKVEIVMRLFHGLSLSNLRNLEQIVLPRGKLCETLKL